MISPGPAELSSSPSAPRPPSRSSARPPRSHVLAGYAIIYVLWGSTYLAIRYAVATLPPFLMMGVRFLVAGAVLVAWGYLRSDVRATLGQWRSATVVGALLILGGTATVGWAEQWVPSGIASLLAATAPLWIVALEWLGPEGVAVRPGRSVIAGIVLGLAGVVVLIGPGLTTGAGGGFMTHATAGAAAVLFGALSWAAGSIYSARAEHAPSVPLAMGMQMITGGLLCVVVGFLIGEAGELAVRPVSSESLLALVYLIVCGSLVGFSAYLWLLQVSRPSRVATHAYVNPVVAVGLGWAIAGEPLTARTLIAATIIVGSVALITTGQSYARVRSE